MIGERRIFVEVDEFSNLNYIDYEHYKDDIFEGEDDGLAILWDI